MSEENKTEICQGLPDKTVHMIDGTFVLLPFDVVRHVKELEQRLKDAESALAFYSNKENWRDIVEEEAYGNNCGLERGCFDSIIYEDCEDDIGGKRARAYFQKHGVNNG